MANNRNKELFLVASFLVIIAAPGLIQTAVELRGGGPLQALDVFRQRFTAKNLRTYEREMEDASWVAKQSRPAMQYAQFRLLGETGDKVVLGRDGWWFYRPGIRYLTERAAPMGQTSPTNTPLSAITAFRDDLAKRGVRLLVVIAPNKESIYPEKLSSRAEGFDIVVCPETRRLMDGLRNAGVEVVDLFETYRAAKRISQVGTASPLYLAQDSHWSPSGVDLAAKAVAQKLTGSGWIRQGGVAYEARLVTVHRLGDVVRMLQVPQIEGEVTPEVIPCRQIIERNTRRPYQDEPSSDILVLGDSFLRIYQQDEPTSAGFVAALAGELRQPLASIINNGGASTLVRQVLHRRPQLLANKKLVIWEFVERDIRFGTEGWEFVPLPPAPPGRDESTP